ncbi:S8 family serine peptidase [Flavobacterium agrisoli]|uniref:S8 family serine peptidase n=1 Tax=Flavobacterium agrisoli TaxID=2793066 RepID=A0A934UIQ9_9FLAO|nr:S8 family serine peptidase [Flavobacterium agrisoli]MBK0369151.1 S8 family serine peptidase [Flavobacterium agrisoli]
MKLFYLICFVLLSFSAIGQEDAWVYLNDKPNAQTFLNQPLTMLSQKALDRRHAQKIPLDISDAPVDAHYLSEIKKATGITFISQSKWLNAIHIQGSVSDIMALKNLIFVEKIDFADKALNITSNKKNTTAKVSKTTLNKSAVVFNYGNASNQVQMLNIPILHENNYTGAGITIALIDAGYLGVNSALPFARLRNNNQLLGGYDFFGRSTNFYTKSEHGTEALSTIGGYIDGSFVGTAPDASFYLFITEDNAYEGPKEESLWVEAAEKADSLGVAIISTSLGYFDDYSNARYSHTYADMDGNTTFVTRGAEKAFSKGIFVVASAGNSGNATEKHIGAPADGSHVFSVGAVTATESKAGFSSIGPTADNRIKPDVMAQGQAVSVINQSGNIVAVNGTSFSCPIIAGSVACLWQAFPEKTNQEIWNMVVSSSDRFTVPDMQYGYGIPDFSVAAQSKLMVADFDKTPFYLYPNPAKSEIIFQLPSEETSAKVSVYSVLGQLLFQSELSSKKNNISLQNFPKGMYFYKLESNAFTSSGKFIKE